MIGYPGQVQYLGGKTRIAKDIAAIVNAERRGRIFWEPFCGGLSVSVALAKAGPGIVSDAHPALISLYRGVRAGWKPPETVTEDDYRAARALPDTDPRKALIGFGCSFGGKWFGGYARQAGGYDYAGGAVRSVRKGVDALAGCEIARLDFLSIAPRPMDLVIYADPPYAGTTGYAMAFDHALFWSRVQGWERAGVPVFVSEYACPVPHRVLWERVHNLQVSGGTSTAARTERLFRVLP